MIVDKTIAVMYPDQCIPRHLDHTTVLYIREADCRPGYVHLEICQLNGPVSEYFINSLVTIKKSLFISSDIFREEWANHYATSSGLKWESNGPSSTFTGSDDLRFNLDFVNCFPCNSWPKEAKEWITRPRLCGWPHQELIDKIVNSGCHVVPVGDKCSEDTFLQWRISFAPAERSLVHSFSLIQLKVYRLLKYFLKQIKETLKETIGDDDILCSYFMRKVHGQNQQILLGILDNYSRMKWMCLSVGNFVKPSIWEHLCDESMQAQLASPKTLQENIMDQDRETLCLIRPEVVPSPRVARKALYLLSTSKSDFDEFQTYFIVIEELRCFALEINTEDLSENETATDNKTRYRRLRKCKYWMSPSAAMGTNVLYLATFYFLTGNFNQCLEMSRRVIKLASYLIRDNQLAPELQTLYRHQYQHAHSCRLRRLQKIYSKPMYFKHGAMYLPHLCLECKNSKDGLMLIPPLPYVLFLNFLCCHELGDTCGRDEALQHLLQVQYDEDQGGRKYWIVHTLLGICHQILGNYHRAIRAYWESKSVTLKWNSATERIAVVYLYVCLTKV